MSSTDGRKSDHEIQTDQQKFDALLDKGIQNALTIRDLDLDAFADGIIAHRSGRPIHDNPGGVNSTPKRLSWTMGWNERALQQRKVR